MGAGATCCTRPAGPHAASPRSAPFVEGESPPVLASEADFARLRGGAGCTIGRTELRGITLTQLERLLDAVRARCAAGEPWWTLVEDERGKRWEASPLRVSEVNLYHINQTLTKPATRARKCSLVELMASTEQRPAYYASHAWSEPLVRTLRCLRQHARDRSYDADTSVWICAFANNQHELMHAVTAEPRDSSFVRAIRAARGVVTIVDAQRSFFSRAWCGFEAFEATIGAPASYLYDVYTASAEGEAEAEAEDEDEPEQPFGEQALRLSDGVLPTESAFIKAKMDERFPVDITERALGFEIERSRASVPSDHAAILAHVRAHSSTRALDATVRARFLVAAMPTLLSREGGVRKVEAALGDLAASQLRRVSLHFRTAPGVGVPFGARAAPPTPAGWVGGALTPRLPRTLQELTLHSANSPDVGARVAEWIRGGAGADSPPPLRLLELPDCAIGDAGARALSAALPAVRHTLEVLGLGSNQLGDEGVCDVATALRGSTVLVSLALDNNRIGDRGAVEIVRALLSSGPPSALRSLELWNNSVADGGADALARALRERGRPLERLGLRGNRVGSAGVLALVGERSSAVADTHTGVPAAAHGPDAAHITTGAPGPAGAGVAAAAADDLELSGNPGWAADGDS